jgi:hypothetical protein
MRRHFVYYRVAAGDLAVAIPAALAGITTLRAEFAGLKAELWRRPGVDAGQVTLMEVFDAGETGIDAEQAGRIEACMSAQLAGWIRGGRHVETFDLLAAAG